MRAVVLTKDYLLYWEKQNRITVRNIVNLLNVKPVYGELLSDLHARVDSERLTVAGDRQGLRTERARTSEGLW